MNKIKYYIQVFIGMTFGSVLHAQNIAISDVQLNANPLSILEVHSSTNDKGILLPRVTSAEMNSITGTVAQGLIVYNTTENMFYYNNSSTATANWVPLLSNVVSSSSGLGGWTILGNTGTNPANNYAGTSDATDFVLKTNNTEKARISSTGNLGIADAAPAYRLTLGGTGNVWGFENTATFLAKNSGGAFQAYLAPRWSDNIMYMDYGLGGFNIRNNASVSTMFFANNGNVGVNMVPGTDKLDVTGNIRASGIIYWGESNTRSERRDNAGLSGVNARSGFFYTDAPSPAASWPVGAASWWHLLDIRHSNTANNYALQISGSYYDQNLYFRKTNNNASTPWTKFVTDPKPYAPQRTTFADGSTTTFYDDTYITMRWNAGNGNIQFAAKAGYTGNWSVYCLFEQTQGSTAADSYAHNQSSANATDWQYIATGFSGSQGPGGVAWVCKTDNNALPIYKITFHRHGTYKTTIVERLDP
jgi:hypothetical protein